MRGNVLSNIEREKRQIEFGASVSAPLSDRGENADVSGCPPMVVNLEYIVPAGEAGMWIENWKLVAQVAASWSGCRMFRLLLDRNDEWYFAVFSEWESMETYTRFVRETGIMWLQRALGHPCVSVQSRLLEALPTELPMGVCR
jgi:hypothetical protein